MNCFQLYFEFSSFLYQFQKLLPYQDSLHDSSHLQFLLCLTTHQQFCQLNTLFLNCSSTNASSRHNSATRISYGSNIEGCCLQSMCFRGSSSLASTRIRFQPRYHHHLFQLRVDSVVHWHAPSRCLQKAYLQIVKCFQENVYHLPAHRDFGFYYRKVSKSPLNGCV